MTEVDKKSQSEVLCKSLINSSAYINSQRISIFLSMNDEIQTFTILKNMFETGKSVFIPLYEKKSSKMDMIQLKSMDDYESLPTTDWNIKQPLISDNRQDALLTGGLDLILVPGLAFTMGGKRLGRGRGYYDGYLERSMVAFNEGKMPRRPLTIGLAFRQQICDDVPVDSHDVILDQVLHQST